MRRQSIPGKFVVPAIALISMCVAGVTSAPVNVQRAVAAVIPSMSSKIVLSPANLKNWGLANPKTERSDIQALDAWKIEKGSRAIVVAVIDTGIDANHKDLSVNLWNDDSKGISPVPGRENRAVPRRAIRANAAQAKSASTLDFTLKSKKASSKTPSKVKAKAAVKKTPVYGWDFVTNSPNPVDDHGHGTHVAGIIGAVANPEAGTSGVAHKVSIMAVKYYSEKNSGAVNLSNTVKAINYAVEKGARIINYSGGGPEFSEAEYLAIKKAEARGVLFVAAAGNNHQDTDKVEHYYYPAAYGLSNVISVAATDINNQLLASSNWGKQKVDVAAPGDKIYSTAPGGKYDSMSGTSQATAFVSGLAALLLSRDPTLTPVQLKKLIVKSVDRIPHLKDKVAAGGRVNAYSALLALKSDGKPKSEMLARSKRQHPLAFAESLGL